MSAGRGGVLSHRALRVAGGVCETEWRPLVSHCATWAQLARMLDGLLAGASRRVYPGALSRAACRRCPHDGGGKPRRSPQGKGRVAGAARFRGRTWRGERFVRWRLRNPNVPRDRLEDPHVVVNRTANRPCVGPRESTRRSLRPVLEELGLVGLADLAEERSVCFGGIVRIGPRPGLPVAALIVQRDLAVDAAAQVETMGIVLGGG